MIGEVVLAHVHEGVVANSDEASRAGAGVVVDFDKLKPVSRLGGDTYARITETYDLPRHPKEVQEKGPHEQAAAPKNVQTTPYEPKIE